MTSAARPRGAPPWCATLAEESGEAVLGTASRVLRWLLVESPGPWGPEGVPSSRGLDAPTTAALQRRAREHGARLLLVRHPAGVACPPEGRLVLLADVRPGRRRLLRRVVVDDAGLLEGALPFAGDPGDGWTVVDEPLFLVCTHGRHDPCCAVRGRPVAAALALVVPDSVLECSHVGGDRFAANVVVVPSGLYLGRVPAAAATGLVETVRAGRVPLDWYRGSSRWLPVEQAAQHFARLRLGLDGIDDLPVGGSVPLGADRWSVTVHAPAGPLAVVVERGSEAEGRLLTCAADGERHAPAYRLVSLEPAFLGGTAPTGR